MFDKLKKLLQGTPPAADGPDFGPLAAAIAPIQAGYVHGLQAALEKARQQHGSAAAVEIMIAFEGPSIFPRNYERLDVLVRLGDAEAPEAPIPTQAIVVGAKPIQPALTELRLPGLLLELRPLQWGGCQFLLEGEAGPDLESALVRWFESWIDIEDELQPGADGLQRVLHSASYSVVGARAASLKVDFGSAPLEAFIDLVRVLARCFSGKVVVEGA